MAGDDSYKGYRGAALDTLKSFGAMVWSDVEIKTARGAYTGIILPRSETADPEHIVLKLRSTFSSPENSAQERSSAPISSLSG